jgi:hypothetical protein
MRKILLLLWAIVAMAVMACEENNTSYGSTFEEIDSEIIDSSPATVEISEECIAAAGMTEMMKERAEAYRRATHGANGEGRNGVYVYTSSVEAYKDAPEKLAARLAVLGFNDIYLSPGKERITGLDPWLRTFISTLKEYGIYTHAICIADNSLYVNEAKVEDNVKLIQTYNNSVMPNERFYGIAADLEPHTCKGSTKPSGLGYEWDSSTGYGIGGANDKLLGLTLDRLEKARNLMPTNLLPQLNEAISYNFQIKNDDKQLSFGTVPQFLTHCNWVVLMSYLDNKDSIWEKSKPSLDAAETVKVKDKGGKDVIKPQTVSICVKTVMNDKDDISASIQAKGWSFLMEMVAHVMQQGKSYTSFRGFDIFTYEGIEVMWEKNK